MPVSADIYGQIQPVQTPNLLQQAALASHVQQGNIKTAELARQVSRQNALEQALAAGGGAEELRRAGFLDESLKLDKAARENKQLDANIAKTNAETGNIDFEQGLKKAEHAASVLSLAKDQQSYDTVLKVLGNTYGPKSVAQMPAVFDPAYVQAEIAKGLTRAQQLADLRAQQGQAITLRGQDITAATARRGQDITARGQDMADARAREANTQGKTQIVETPQGFQLVDKQTGQSRPAIGPDGKTLQGKANDRVLTDAQAKANLFGMRMKAADEVLSGLEDKGVTNTGIIKGTLQGVAGMTPFMGDKLSDAVGSAMNVVPGVLGGPSGQQQQVEQARRDFINAVLRRESGAAIAPSEFANAERQYFPQPGDSKGVLEQKRRNRQLAIKGLEVEVPGGFRGSPAAKAGADAPATATKVLRFDANGNPL